VKPKPTPPQPDDYDFEERAAIMEFDGRLPREEAEAKARAIIEKEKKDATRTLRKHTGA
jgi:hypothetical protein